MVNDGTWSNFIHEWTHGGQIARGEIIFNEFGIPLSYPPYNEVLAYQTQLVLTGPFSVMTYSPILDCCVPTYFDSLNQITATNISLMVDHNNNFMYTLLGQ